MKKDNILIKNEDLQLDIVKGILYKQVLDIDNIEILVEIQKDKTKNIKELTYNELMNVITHNMLKNRINKILKLLNK